ncbi:hypothetical protein WJX81_007176 [Elliptochloris bilobata]|uniref:UBX domain-containing protein n=1 Tax=Elliptochloris bilobata TaxID=381761 RepID=A0AAW1S839_9CHLO
MDGEAAHIDEAIATFSSITGADAHTAEHTLKAFGWDLNRGVNFFLENGARMPLPSRVPGLDDDEPVLLGEEAAPSWRRGGGAGGAAARGSGLSSAPIELDDESEDEEDEDLHMLAQHRASREAAAIDEPGGAGPAHNWDASFLPQQPRRRRSRPGGAAAAIGVDLDNLQALGRRLGIPPDALEDLPGAEGDDVDMPADINLEEARMLEAAMLGVPYEGRMPDYGAPAAPPAPVAPDVAAHRDLRREQDDAYQASLRADRQKAEAAAAAERDRKEAAAASERAAAMAAAAEAQQAAEAADAAARFQAGLEAKREGLPPEPPAGDPSAVDVMVRLPHGMRVSRRFLSGAPLAALFAWMDTELADPALPPGAFRLVTQFPRRVLEHAAPGTLADAGLSQRQEAVFVEPV